MKNTIVIVATELLILISVFRQVVSKNNKVTEYVSEEEPKGTIVANMAKILSLRYDERAGRSFKLLSQNLITKSPSSTLKGVELITLNEETGVMTLAEKIDREKICRKAEECIIQIQAVMLPQKHFSMLNLDIKIGDINDNPPKFFARKINITLPEAETFINDVINLDKFQAHDKDIGLNSEILYTLTGNPYFTIIQYGDEAGNPHLGLKVLKMPDHELETLHRMTLYAADRGEESLTDHVPLFVTIADSNDHDPIFDQQDYSIYLEESTKVSSLITTVHATDLDSGDYGRIRYFVVPPTPRTIEQLVSVDPENGEVRLKKKLDKEIHDGLRILIQAKDSDPVKPRVGKAWLRIFVEDVNDNNPVINVNFIVDAKNKTGYIQESAGVRTFIAYVDATDEDEGLNGDVGLKIKSFGKKKQARNYKEVTGEFILSQDGLLSTGRLLDRETYQQYIIEINACDKGSPRRCTFNNITVVVLDVNDNSPVFDIPSKTVVLPEDSEVGVTVTGVSAFDADAAYPPSLWLRNKKVEPSMNGVITYSIAGGDTNYFNIGERSGNIKLGKKLDHETQSIWKLIINARDGGWPKYRDANCTVIIRVGDINDNRPIFKNPKYNNSKHYATILKDQPIMIVQAEDRDNGINSKIQYRIIEEDGIKSGGKQPLSGLFIVNPTTGTLRLNFSKSNLTNFLGWHHITIKASDSASSPLSVVTAIQLKVTNEIVPNPLTQAGIEPKFIAIVIILAIAALILMILIVVTLLRRRKKKQLQTYNCKSAKSRARHWLSSPSQNKTGSDTQGCLEPGNTLESAYSDVAYNMQPYGQGNESTATRNFVPESNEVARNKFASHGKASNSSLILPVVRSLDLDSGRGDSGSENENNDFDANEAGPHVQPHNQTRENVSRSYNFHDDADSSRTSELGPRCEESCREYGHSDSCWLPSPNRDSYCAPILPCPGTLRYTAPPSQHLFHYNCIDYQDTRVSESISRIPGDRYSTAPTEYFQTLPARNGQASNLYYHGYDGDLETIDEGAPLGVRIYEGIDTYDVDDVSSQTHLNLSTSLNHSNDIIAPTQPASSRTSALYYISGRPKNSPYRLAPDWEQKKYKTISNVQRTRQSSSLSDLPHPKSELRYTPTFRPLAPSPGSEVRSHISTSSSENSNKARVTLNDVQFTPKEESYESKNFERRGSCDSRIPVIQPSFRSSLAQTRNSIVIADPSNKGTVSIQEAQEIVDDIDKLLLN
uniref:protocadherin-18-like n=1 Tax=Styela clava TaxID=7725 RepID=UPI00193981B3|nr:protocadherin-18-like [Styela clava]